MRICELPAVHLAVRWMWNLTVKPDVLPPLWFPDLAVSAFVSGEPEVNI